MCGIAGLLLHDPDPRAAAWTTAMTQRLHHRGPDSGGAVVFATGGRPFLHRELASPALDVDWGHFPAVAGLGARRLAVLDLTDAGQQPMSADDGRIWLVHNGEIYNHAALRDALRARGVAFTGSSDTEVVLAAYRAWGTDCFERFEGMWAIALFDWIAGRLILSRDRLGIKPLFVTRFDAGFAFASEIKALLALSTEPPRVNERRLADFLVRGLVDHTDETFFEGVWSLPAGACLQLSLRRTEADAHADWAHGSSLWSIWQPSPNWADRPDAESAVRASLVDAVRSHLRSDVPVGSCLSGGIDSSALVALIHQAATAADSPCGSWTQHTFTAALTGHSLDEAAYARSVLDALPGLTGAFVTPTAGGLLRDLDTLLWHQEQPFGSPSIYMQWEVMRLARQTGVTVLMDGQGGDELFCGYPGAWPPYLAHLLTRGRIAVLLREFRALRAQDADPARRRMLHIFAALLPQAVRDRLRWRAKTRARPWLDTELFDRRNEADSASADPLSISQRLSAFSEALGITWIGRQSTETTYPPSAEASHRAERPASPRGCAFARWTWRSVLAESLPGLLRFEDRNSMAFGVEARVPFLDRRVVELAMSLPPRHKLRGGRTKVVLREAVADLLPPIVRNRTDKIGFAAPTAEWMSGDLRPWWRDLLASRSFLERGCFDVRGVEALALRVEPVERPAGDAAAARPDASAQHEDADDLWRVALTEAWARRFLDRAAGP